MAAKTPPFDQAQSLEELKRICAEAWAALDRRLKEAGY